MRRVWVYGFILLAASALVSCRHPQQVFVKAGTLSFQAPDSIPAGSLLKVTVCTKDFTPAESIWIQSQGSWGTSIREFVTGRDKEIRFRDSLTGMLTLRALYHGKLLAEKKIRILPVVPAEPMDSYLGSKSVIANGEDWAMITAIPTDSFGNLIPENTEVDFLLLRPDKRVEHYTMPTRAGVVYRKITAGTVAGKTFVGASVQGVNSKEKELQEVAGFPEPFTIAAESKSIYADSRQTFKVKTSVLKDRYNNIVPEGTAVFFDCRDANGTRRQLSAYTLRGVAELFMQNPASAGTMTIEGSTFGGGASNQLQIYFTSAFQDIPLVYDSAAKRLFVGYLRGKLNQLVPNGTEVQLQIDSSLNTKAETVGGMALFDLSDLLKGRHNARVTVFDTTVQKEIIVP
ncbi:MAG: hypothetical protein INR73_08445 [Williamsia sp.]|nr:hypothetical protein [Williamsia sp.]